jgi:RNA polymerase sigma-70 factor (ECF subfamily)
LNKSQTIQPGSGYPAPVGALDGMKRADEITAAALHERYLGDVCRYVLRHVRGIEEAEDIAAEVFAAAAAGLRRFRGQCPPYLWLLSIARRKIIDARRRRAARRETLASELDLEILDVGALWEQARSAAGGAMVEGPETALMRAEAQRVVRDLLSQLNPDQREAVLLQYVERLSVADIAVVMGRSPASVTGLLQRARAALYRRGRAYFLGGDEGHER